MKRKEDENVPFFCGICTKYKPYLTLIMRNISSANTVNIRKWHLVGVCVIYSTLKKKAAILARTNNRALAVTHHTWALRLCPNDRSWFTCCISSRLANNSLKINQHKWTHSFSSSSMSSSSSSSSSQRSAVRCSCCLLVLFTLIAFKRQRTPWHAHTNWTSKTKLCRVTNGLIRRFDNVQFVQVVTFRCIHNYPLVHFEHILNFYDRNKWTNA